MPGEHGEHIAAPKHGVCGHRGTSAYMCTVDDAACLKLLCGMYWSSSADAA
jgi:hypothetical protein